MSTPKHSAALPPDVVSLWNSAQVAAFLNLSKRTVYRLAADGVLTGVRVGKNWRFDPRTLPGQNGEVGA